MNKDFEHIVIGGLQRSGTSLIRAILGSHPEISIYQWDLGLWTKFSIIYRDKKLSTTAQKKLIQEVINHPKQKASVINLHESDFSSILKSKYLTKEFFYIFYTEFLHLYLKKSKGSYVGLKTPENEFYSPIIFRKFPKTKFIHIIRNPLDVAVSLKKIKHDSWGGSVNYFSHIWKWKKSADLLSENSKLFPQNYYTIKYEDLIINPKGVVTDICRFLNIDFQKEMLDMNNHPGWEGNNSSYKKNNIKSLNTESINRYKDILPEHIQNIYFYFLNEQLKNLGYSTQKVTISFQKIFQYKVNAVIENMKIKLFSYTMRSILYRPLKLISKLFKN